MEEPGCSASTPYAHAFTSNLEISGDQVTVDYEGMTFTSIRYTGMTGDADAGVVLPTDGGTLCTVTTTGEEGVCISTTECAALGDKSTAGYCPGAADIECCTVVTKDAGKKDAGEKDAGEKDAGEKDADEKDAGEKPSDAASEPRDAGATPEDATATVEDAAVGAGPDGATSKGSQGKDACAGGGCTAEDSGAEVAPSSGGCSAASGGAAGPSGGIALGLVGVPVLVRRKRRARS
jgi:MYXO-CTERM domain-containing protein